MKKNPGRKKNRVRAAGAWMAACLLLLAGCGGFGINGSPVSGSENTWEGLVNKKKTVKSVSAERYAYSTLSNEAKLVYDEIYQALFTHEEKVTVSTMDTGVLDRAYQAVSADYGEIFWASGYVYTQYKQGDTLLGLVFSPEYTMNESERREMQQKIDPEVELILAGIGMEAGDYEKARYIYEYLASNVDYELESEENQNIISVFIHKKTVCQGYASATQYLLQRLGIQSSIVTGTADGGPHAWNLVRLDGAYYYLDTTWGNSMYQSASEGRKRFTNYNYFAVTTDEINKTHTADTSYALPECTAVEDNYYVREGLYFTTADMAAAGAACRESYVSKADSVSLKFASPELYLQAKEQLIDAGKISDYCSGLSSFYYVEDLDQNVLTLCF